jgi:hypothetical protein
MEKNALIVVMGLYAKDNLQNRMRELDFGLNLLFGHQNPAISWNVPTSMTAN